MYQKHLNSPRQLRLFSQSWPLPPYPTPLNSSTIALLPKPESQKSSHTFSPSIYAFLPLYWIDYPTCQFPPTKPTSRFTSPPPLSHILGLVLALPLVTTQGPFPSILLCREITCSTCLSVDDRVHSCKGHPLGQWLALQRNLWSLHPSRCLSCPLPDSGTPPFCPVSRRYMPYSFPVR